MISIDKSISDSRDYKGGTLNNNIKYILINDKFLTKSYVSVCINAGSFNNISYYEGLAHFLEHMLFMGSTKYPIENYFMNKINEYGGSTNAYTENLRTVYYFNVYDNGLEDVIDIFSRFFIDPLFNKESIMREINAVNSEHMKNINSDFRKIYQLILYLSNENCPVNTFCTGSLNTLNKNDIREKMIEFYNKYYTSDNISICIASSKSFDDLYSIINHTFANILPSKKKYNLILSKPFYNNNKNKVFFFKTSNNIYDIYYIWEIPFINEYYNSKDFNILSLLLLNKSSKSLYFNLKKKGYLNNIDIDILEEGLFILNLSLSKEGYANINYINTYLYSYINNIYKINIRAYAEYYQKIININFNYNNKIDNEDLCNILSTNHFIYNTKNVLIDDSFINNIKRTEEYITLFKKYFVHSNKINAVIIVCSKKNINNNLIYNKLREYNTVYGIINDDDITFKINKIINTKICCFDLANDYLDIIIKKNDKLINDIPYLIYDNQWFGCYSKNGEPMINICLQLNNNIYFNCPENYILTNISTTILNFLISTKLYKPLDVCYTIYFSQLLAFSSININIFGPNNILFITKLINELINFILNIEKYFDKLSDLYIINLIINIKNSLKNIKYFSPIEYNNLLISYNIYSTNYTKKKLLKYLKNIIHDIKNNIIHNIRNNIKNFMKNLLNNTSITSFIYGDINKNDVNNLFDKLNVNFKIPHVPYPVLYSLCNNIIKHPNKNESSNLVSFYYNIGSFKPLDYLLMKLVINIYSEIFFDELRTKKQLGYLVSMNYELFRDHYYIYQKIQSTKPLNYIIKQINNFNKNIIKDVKSNFKKYNLDIFISSLKKEISEPANNLNEQYSKYLNEIITRNYLFNRKEILFNYIKLINPDKLKLFIMKYIYNKKIIRIIKGNNI